MKPVWDLTIVGAGPAGTAAALGALAVEPGLRVLLLDRSDFPRDKACGDGIAPHVLDLLAEVGVPGLLDDWRPVRRFRLARGPVSVDRLMARPNWVVPREVFDARLVAAAVSAGAQLVRHRVRELELGSPVVVDGSIATRVLVGADGAQSAVRKLVGWKPGPMALAIRGYAPTPPGRAASQVIAYGGGPQPSYGWSFDRGDGWSNVGYGERLTRASHPTRAELLERLDELLPGAAEGGRDWRGARLPLAGWSWRPPPGPVMLTGDAAGLVNPMTGEGIYYAVVTGLMAGRIAATVLRPGISPPPHPGPHAGTGLDPGGLYRHAAVQLLGRHLRDTAVTAALTRSARVLDAGIRAAAADQRVFDDLVELGLADGMITGRLLRALGGALVR